MTVVYIYLICTRLLTVAQTLPALWQTASLHTASEQVGVLLNKYKICVMLVFSLLLRFLLLLLLPGLYVHIAIHSRGEEKEKLHNFSIDAREKCILACTYSILILYSCEMLFPIVYGRECKKC
jgi:hypothetical protein